MVRRLADALFGQHAPKKRQWAKLVGGTLLLSTLPLVVILLVLPVHVQSILTETGHAHLTQVANDLANLTHNEMQRHLETALNLSRIEALPDAVRQKHAGTLSERELVRVNRQIDALVKGLSANYYQGIFLCGADGISFGGVLRSGDVATYVALDVRDRAYFAQARDTLRPVISDPMHSKVGGVPIVVLAVPVLTADGQFAGLIGLPVEIGPLAHLISTQRLGRTGYPFAVDRHGLMVAHPDPARYFKLDFSQVPGAAPLVERMWRGETGVQSYVSSLGERKLAAFTPEPLSGWSIAASIEEAEFAEPAHRIRWLVLALIGGCAIVALVVATVFAVGREKLNRTVAEARAREAKLAEQAALLDQTNDGIFVCDLDHVIVYWNRGAERLYGWSAAEAVGRRLNELLKIGDLPFLEATDRVRRRGVWFGHLQKTTRDGRTLTLDCRWTLLRDEDGHPKSILATDTDITERKQMEEKFLRTQRLESIGTLAGGIAHDLNNLITPIVVGLDLLRSSPRPPEDESVFQLMVQSTTRATRLVRQVLSFARGEEGARVSVHVGYVAREVEAIARSTFPRNIAVRIQCPKDLWLVQADPTQLNQVLLNLFVNARDAMPAGGQLTLSARNIDLEPQFSPVGHNLAPGPYVLIEVADTGSGIPREIVEKIFDPFFTTKEPGKGTGLGLSTVLGIVRDHDGTVNVYSEPGRGTVFKIYLPACAETAETLAPAAPTEPATGGDGRLVLLVEDEPSIRDVAKHALEIAGYRVVTAGDGAQAFALYHRHRKELALVFTDMMMPVMDGTALLAALRRADPHLPVVAASGLHDNNNQIKAAEAGIRHFVCKPYTTASLLATIKRALDERPARPSAGSPAAQRPLPLDDGRM